MEKCPSLTALSKYNVRKRVCYLDYYLYNLFWLSEQVKDICLIEAPKLKIHENVLFKFSTSKEYFFEKFLNTRYDIFCKVNQKAFGDKYYSSEQLLQKIGPKKRFESILKFISDFFP